MKKVIDRRKRSKTLSEVKQVKNIRMNLRKSFLSCYSDRLHDFSVTICVTKISM